MKRSLSLKYNLAPVRSEFANYVKILKAIFSSSGNKQDNDLQDEGIDPELPWNDY
jgi:hypothetical protein